MPIEIDNPITVPAVEYKEIWVRHVQIILGGCNGEPVALSAQFGLVGRDAQGAGAFLPNYARALDTGDLYADAANDPELAQLMTAVIGKLINMAKGQGVFDPPVSHEQGED